MKTIVWLIRREYAEHRGLLFWTPAVASLLIIALALIGIASGIGEGPAGDQTYQLLPIEAKVRLILNTAFMLSFAPMLAILAASLFFYSLSSLVDERKDRSILFWKSLPLSDGITVTSKIVTALLCAPVVTITLSFITTVIIIAMMCLSLLFKGTHLFAAAFGAPTLAMLPMQIIGLIPIYILWALPTIGWLFMISTWARSNFFLWAFGMPLLAISVVKVVGVVYNLHWGGDWVVDHVLLRCLVGFIPGAWTMTEHIGPELLINSHQAVDLSQVFSGAWKMLGTPELWSGVVAGTAMLFATVRLRQMHVEA